jgi:hypothetical protein
MANRASLRESWLRPFLFYGNNPLSLLGGALTTASAMVLVGFWIIRFFGRGASSNPYLGIILDLCLPALFVVGLLLIPIGIVIRRSYLRGTDQVPSVFPEINLRDPVFRKGVDFVVVATLINFVIVGTASYRGVAYMDTVSFCGAACHVMLPEFTALNSTEPCSSLWFLRTITLSPSWPTTKSRRLAQHVWAATIRKASSATNFESRLPMPMTKRIPAPLQSLCSMSVAATASVT